MDPNKKFLYFNADSAALSGPTEASATTVPVSTSAGMEVTSASNFKMLFKESVETDTLDVEMARTADSDPREIMESIVNQINYSKEPLLVVGDNSTSEYADHRLSAVSITFADHSIINFQGHIQSDTTNAVDAGAGSPTVSSNIGEVNSEIISTFFIDLADGSNTVACPGTIHQAIGIASSTTPAYFTQITTAKNGIVYRGEIICVEAPTGTGTTGQINLVANSVGTIDLGEDTTAGTSDIIMNHASGEFTLAEVRNFDSSTLDTAGSNNPQGGINAGGIQDHYLYLAPNSSSQAGGNYDSGKFLIRLFGAKTTGL
tara:strand:- start:160 stop:1107 length:948 start_codon:yes stop_codon:yes gene_type:complete